MAHALVEPRRVDTVSITDEEAAGPTGHILQVPAELARLLRDPGGVRRRGAAREVQALEIARVALQYKRTQHDFYRGSFRVRGDVLDIFPAHYEDRAWRVNLFGDEVESIEEFDPLTGQKTDEL